MKKEYLNEENYNKTKSKISLAALLVLIIGVGLGLTLITIGISNQKKTNEKYSEETQKQKITALENDLETEKENIESQIKYLENKGIVYKSSASYKDGEAYDLKIMTNALDPSFNYCAFDEYNDNDLTEKYCDIKEELNDVKNANLDFDKSFNSFSSIPFFMFGGFVIISSLMISAFIYTIAKRREILAFAAQQTMPIAKEGMEKMAPTIGKVGKTIVKDIAPAYGEIAKEISKGIKDGLKENKDTKKREK